MTGTTARDHAYTPRAGTMPLNCIDYASYSLARGKATTPNGQLLHLQLSTMYSPKVNTGIINPTAERILAFNDTWTETDLVDAAEDILDGGDWAVERDGHGNVIQWIPLFHEELLADKEAIRKPMVGSLDHILWLARYSRLETVARLVAVKAVAATRPIRNSLGADFGDRTKARYRSEDGVKYRIDTLFDADFLHEDNEAGWAYIRNLTTIPEEYTTLAKPLQVEELTAYTHVDTATLANALLHGPAQDLFTVRATANTATLMFTGLYHQQLWNFQRIPGGSERTMWEIANGYFPIPDAEIASSHRIEDGYTHRPIPGYHWIYELVVRDKDGQDRVIQVGETTQTVSAREKQHLHNPTNNHAHVVIEAYIAQGNAPRARVVGIAHADTVAVVETELMERRKREGHHLNNWIIDAAHNQGTIKRDNRFDGLSADEYREALNDAYRVMEELVEAEASLSVLADTEDVVAAVMEPVIVRVYQDGPGAGGVVDFYDEADEETLYFHAFEEDYWDYHD